MNEKRPKLAVFAMGGTIDSRNAAESDGTAVPLKRSMVESYIKSLRLNFDVVFSQTVMKDSRKVLDEHRDRLIDEILRTGVRHNLVTHGTYKMNETGLYLHKSGKLDDRVITLTGSMGTLIGSVDDEGRLAPSDGQFNLGYAISQTFFAENGIYQCMNGEMFHLPEDRWLHTEKEVVYVKNGVEQRIVLPQDDNLD